jgi:hypothetical protein
MSLREIIQDIIEDLDLTFFYGAKWEQNLQDNETIFPAAFLDYPFQSDDTLIKSGAIKAKYNLTFFLCDKSEPDYTSIQHDAICATMRQKAVDVVNALQEYDSSVIEVTGTKRTDVHNVFDVNVTGVILTVSITMIETPTCE